MEKYNKLVRDNIPKIIHSKNKIAETEILENEKAIKYLRAKLNEEIKEFDKSKDITELADILEVIYSMAKHYGYSEAYLNLMKKKKKEERGSFDKNILLKSVKERE